MGKIKQKLYDWKDRLKDRHMLSIIIVAFVIIAGFTVYTIKREREFRQVSENSYNLAFFELVDYVQNVENYLAKSLISNTAEQGAETLTHVWREANLAQSYLSRLPISSQELGNTSKFLNQVSDYSYSLSRRNIKGEDLTEQDFTNLKELHTYSIELENTLNQLSADLNDGRIEWGELTKKGTVAFATEVSNLSKESFSNLESNFHEYSGLIYDGAFSEHMTSAEKRGLTGEEIEEEKAKQIATVFIGEDKIKEITSTGLSENTDMPAYNFNVQLKKDEKNTMVIAITKKGGHIVYMDYNKNVEAETISQERANEIGKAFLVEKGYPNMKETYYIKQSGVVTVNYAYNQETQNGNVVMYPDLIKLKIALDTGEIVGIETTGYINSHEERNLPDVKITKEEAKVKLNPKLVIQSEGLAMIPTEWKTEVFCWEFKGKVEETEFLVYINCETGEEEDILVIKNTPNGTLTM